MTLEARFSNTAWQDGGFIEILTISENSRESNPSEQNKALAKFYYEAKRAGLGTGTFDTNGHYILFEHRVKCEKAEFEKKGHNLKQTARLALEAKFGALLKQHSVDII